MLYHRASLGGMLDAINTQRSLSRPSCVEGAADLGVFYSKRSFKPLAQDTFSRRCFMGCVIALLVVFLVLLFPIFVLPVGGGILYGIYDTFFSPGFIFFFVIVLGGVLFLVIYSNKEEDKFLDEQAVLFASKDNDEDRAKVVRAYLLRKNRTERAFNTGKSSPPPEISFVEAQAILEGRVEELEKYKREGT